MGASQKHADQRGKVLRLSLSEQHALPLPTLALASYPDGRHVLSSGLDFRLRLWNLESGICTRTWAAGGPISCIAVEPVGRWALLGAVRGIIWWHLEKWDVCTPSSFWTHKGQITAIAYAAERGMALGASEDLVIYCWELETGRALEALAGHRQTPSALAVDGRGDIAVSGAAGGQLRLWDLEKGVCSRAWQGHHDKIADLAISADGQFAISAGRDRLLRLWDLPNGECIGTLEGHTAAVKAVVLSGDPRRAISGGDDGLRLWDLERFQCLSWLDDSRVAALALSLDGSYMVASAKCNMLSVWPTGGIAQLKT